jgi:uncharacterized protein
VTERAWSVSIHDVAPSTWPDCLRLLDLLSEWRVSVSLLVVPDFHGRGPSDADPAFMVALRERTARGDEVVLHGYYHRDDAPRSRTWRDWWRRRVLTDGEGEMAAMNESDAARRIASGTALLAAVGLPPAGFVAPAWQLGPGARSALIASGLAYTATRDELIALPDWTALPAPSLVYSSRSALRRTLSRAWNGHRLDAMNSAPLLRVALHPIDALYPRVVSHWRKLIQALASERSPVLESRWLRERLAT